jgi:hypothetical protein
LNGCVKEGGRGSELIPIFELFKFDVNNKMKKNKKYHAVGKISKISTCLTCFVVK